MTLSVQSKLTPDRMIGLAFALAMHAAALYGLWSYRLLPTPDEAVTLFVNMISPPKPEVKEEPKPPPPRQVKLEKPRPVQPRPQPQQLVVEAPVTLPGEPLAPPPPSKPEPLPPIEAPPALPPAPEKPAGPVQLGNDLSVSCPERTPPNYPAAAKRMGEQGRVVLRVELDETGKVSAARVTRSSGSARLDQASLAAVGQWHCNPARRGGEPVKAVALQPFEFILEGR
ncbi:MAG: energy transducer TonB [Candidatus Methylophosphatis roskildensis]